MTGTNQTNAAVIFLPLKSFAERNGKPEQSAKAISAYLNEQYSHIQEAFSLVLLPPPVQGIGQAGGFKMQVEDRSGLATPQQFEAATQTLIAEAGKDPQIAAAFSTFRASVPQLYANVDRVKAKKANVAVTDIFQALQVNLGSFYINDFNYLGRTYQSDCACRCSLPGIGFRRRATQNSQSRRRDGSAGNRHGFARYCRCRSHQSIRPLSLGRNQRRRRTGRQQRAGHRNHG